MTDPVHLAERLRDAIGAGRLEGLGELWIDGEGVVVRWRGGSVPPVIQRLIAGSDTPVEVRPCRYTGRELRDVIQRLVEGWDLVPFTMTTYPLHPRSVQELALIDVKRYLGLHVDEATIRALGDGWVVRSYGDGAGWLTLELRPNRVDLHHDRSGVVIQVDVG